MTLAEFIEARLEEDEEYNRLWLKHTMYPHTRGLREVAAKRAILELHRPDEYGCQICEQAVYRECKTLRALAAVYSDHPDYQAEWTP